MRLRCLIALPLLALLLGAVAPQSLPPLQPANLESFTRFGTYRTEPAAELDAWESALREALHGDLDDAAATIAARFEMTPPQMRELARLWVTWSVRRDTISAGDRALVPELRRRFLALVRATDHKPLVVRAAAVALDSFASCSAADFTALLDGARDRARTAWEIARGQLCLESKLRFAALAPDRAAPALIDFTDWGSMQPIDALPVYAWLASDAGLARVAPDRRAGYEVTIRRRQLSLLFDSGLTTRAVAILDAMSPDLRARVLSAERDDFTATIDGLPYTFSRRKGGTELALDLAAAYALAGRNAEAARLLEAVKAAGLRGLEEDSAFLDHLLHHADEDPYPLAEEHTGIRDASAPVLDAVRCRVLSEPQYGACPTGRGHPRPYFGYKPRAKEIAESEPLRAAVAALHLPGYAEDRAPFAAALAEEEALGPERASVLTLPTSSRFAVSALPAGFSATRPVFNGLPGDMAPLPEAFFPIRFEREGARVVVLSRADRYLNSPAGRGEYWAHLSDDGGRHWRSYFTGLLAQAPYVILSTSNLPMLNADMLDLEVESLEFGVNPREDWIARRTKDLALHIPLAAITADSNGDGLSDLAAHWLLLDRPRTARGTPFVVGTAPEKPCTKPLTDEEQLLTLVIESMSGRAGTDWSDPLLLADDPARYACIRARRKVVVYHPADIELYGGDNPRLATRDVPGFTFNRARDRAFGGGWLARRVDGVWQVTPPIPPTV